VFKPPFLLEAAKIHSLLFLLLRSQTFKEEGAGEASGLDCAEQSSLGMAVEATALHPPAWAQLDPLMSEPP